MLTHGQEVRRSAQRPVMASQALGVITLVPNSSIQFLDFTVSRAAVAGVTRQFLEEDRGGEPALYSAVIEDGVPYHPLTGAVADVARTLGVSGEQALEPFLDAWLPVPVLRVRGIATGLGYALDEGPSNWARVFITRSGGDAKPVRDDDPAGERTVGADDAPAYHVVLALDTHCSGRPGDTGGIYAAPSLEDARSGRVFRFSSDEADVAWFVSEAWVDDWLRERADLPRADNARFDSAHGGSARARAEGWQPTLGYLARYLTLLAVLETCGVPDIRFTAPQSERDSVAVDLVLDIGNTRVAVLVGQPQPANGRGRSAAEPFDVRSLPMRDLTEPWRVHQGAMPARVEFASASFGREALSRLSGRSNAFFWPSVVRVGHEAERLAAARPTTEDTTGLTSPMRYLWDGEPTETAWRFVRVGGGASAQRGALVCGAPLVYVGENGTVHDAREHVPAPVKPRFARAALATFLVGELLVHAIAAINAPGRRGSGAQGQLPRRIGRILLTVPASLLARERSALRARVRDAVRLVWQTPAWLDGQPAAAVPWPEVSFVEDNATNTILGFLHNEVVDKFRGRAESYFELAGRRRPEHRAGGSLRVGCLDVGGGSSALTIATFAAAPDAPLQCTIDVADGTRVGGDDVARAIAERHVLPALERALTEARLANAGEFLADILGGRSKGRPSWLGGFGRRFARDLAYPLALALIKVHAEEHELAGDVASRHTIGALLSRAGVTSRIIADELDDLAADEGAAGFACQSVPITFFKDEMTATMLSVLRPSLAAAADLLETLDCDVILLGGLTGQLPLVLDTLIEAMPARAGQIIQLASYRIADWYTLRTAGGLVGDAKGLAAMGALLATVATSGPLAGMRIVRPGAAPLAVGPMTGDGTLPETAELFRLSEGDRRPGGARDGAADVARPTSVTLTAEPGFTLGVRRIALESWPATPLYVLEADAAAARGRSRMPLRITIEQVESTSSDGEPLVLVKAMDAEGANVAPGHLSLRFRTLLDRQPDARAYWLDCGRIFLDRGGPP